MSPFAGVGWVAVCGVSANEYSCALGTHINFGDLAPYLLFNLCWGGIVESCGVICMTKCCGNECCSWKCGIPLAGRMKGGLDDKYMEYLW